ncbi:hypothetical protein QAD02_009650 [Eretmocerus hayati]|uniref:Uncharacterized protein n=1 Tax=Eretmocerus hayati TaxID=131215 RepID=A0ACC2NAA3_9HYME|nr:hypothetical protein QAD02_009650 [Eretmocerus hayati]
MDPPMFVAYAPQTNGVPLESKLATYMNRQSSGVVVNAANVTKHLSNLSLDGSKKSNIAPEFVPSRTHHVNSNNASTNVLNNSYGQPESVGGATYYYVQNHGVDPSMPVIGDGAEIVSSSEPPPLAYVYPGTPSYLQPPAKGSKSNSPDNTLQQPQVPSFFVHDTLRMEILQKNMLSLAQPDPVQFPNVPAEVENYHELVPLEILHNKPASTVLGYQTSTFKATNIKNGTRYCLRRIHDFRLTNTKCMVLVDMWKKLAHTNLVQLREVFTTKAFGDNSIVFIYDYHPGSETLLNKHFTSTELNGYTDPFASDPSAPRPYSHTKNTMLRHQHTNMLPESIIWSYIIQLTAAFRVIHAAGLAFRGLDPTKVLLTSRTRLRLSSAGVPDVVMSDANQAPNPLSLIPHYQQEDLIALGKLVLALACRSLLAIHRDNMHASLELVARTYSSDLRNLILYLLSNQARKSVTDLMPMIGARFYTQLDAAQLYSDVLENELAKELENGRLFRLIVKLATINERPELSLDTQWSETGDRYMLKLFRDYVFHQNTTEGRPWIDLAHVVSCLNKLDVGAPDKICLVSRDEQSVLIVSYAELRHCLETSFNELVQAAKGSVAEAV